MPKAISPLVWELKGVVNGKGAKQTFKTITYFDLINCQRQSERFKSKPFFAPSNTIFIFVLYMSIISVLIYFLVLFVIELVYFKFANHFNIIDKPNHRSSHTRITIRGGGIIFTKAVAIWFLVNGFPDVYFVLGLLAITVISFLDDVYTLNNKLRLSIHLVAVLLLFQQWNLFSFPWYFLLLALVFVIGTINAYNFMDGINGITGGNSLVTIVSLYFINEKVVNFTSSELLLVVGISLLVFNFFNFRPKAKCFAGDVGSVSIAFIIVYFIGLLIIKTQNFNYIMLLLVYGLDTAFTVFFRKIRKENIFEAHRSHFYQYLSNQLKYPHIGVSIIYMSVQLFINVLLVYWVKDKVIQGLFLLVTSACLFLLLRFVVEGKQYLLKAHK